MKVVKAVKNLLRGLTALALLLAVGLVYGYMEVQKRLQPAAEQSREIVVDIPAGYNAAQIGQLLEQKGVIRDGRVFRYLTAYRKLGPKLKAGEHVLNPALSTPDILDSLVKGSFKLYRLTIPEGLTMKQIARQVQAAGMAEEEQFLTLCQDPEFIKALGLEAATLEGYLFPETYHFLKGVSGREIIENMVRRFWTVWKRYESLAAQQDLNRHEIVTLASIIEKETGADFERPVIAGVFLNRLKKGMRLETDPTVIYGIKDFDGDITRKHLRTPTPYNTYLISGLPPGPIANPGEDSIKAVLEPARVEYLYFVSKNDGTHQFSKTLREHNRAVNKYQRRGRNK